MRGDDYEMTVVLVNLRTPGDRPGHDALQRAVKPLTAPLTPRTSVL